MELKELLVDKIKSADFQGIAIKIGEQSEVHWWNYGESKLNKLVLEIKLEKSISFHCISGHFKMFD